MAGIRIQLELDDGSFTTRMLHAGESLEDFNQKLGKTVRSFEHAEAPTRSFIGHMRDVIVIVAAARIAFENLRNVTTGWAADIIKVNAEFERMTYLLKGMSSAKDPMKEARGEVQQIRQMALEMPYSVKAITDTFVKLRASGTDPLKGSLQAVIDTVAAFGGTESQLKRAALALQEMAGKGVVQTKELRRQLGQDIPRAVELMARALGVSIPQLTQLVEKGTLDAATSMKAMYGEWERTFGGSAKQLMQTFNGELAKTGTLLQNLALDTGNSGYFDTVKVQLKDLNQFLSGQQAKVLAHDLGDALSLVVRDIRMTLDWVVRFRHEIGGVAEIMAFAFALRVGIGSLMALGGGIRGLVTKVTALRGEMNALNISFRINRLNMLAGQLGVAGMGISRFTGYLQIARLAVMGLGTALTFTSEFLLPIGALILGAAYAFGLFSDKAKDAYNDIKKFGATSKEQLDLGEKYLDRYEKELDLLYRKKKLLEQIALANKAAMVSNDIPNVPGVGSVPTGKQNVVDALTELQNQIDAKEKEADQADKTMAQRRREFAKMQIDQALEDVRDEIDQESLLHSRAYDESQKTRAEAFDKARMDYIAHNKDIEGITKENEEAQRQAALDDADWHYKILQKYIDKEKELVASNQVSKDTGSAVIDDLTKRQIEILNQKRDLEAEPVGPQPYAKGVDPAKILEKAQQMLLKAQGDIEGYKAGVAGAKDEVAKLIYLVENNPKLQLGDNQQLAQTIDQLKEAYAIREKWKDEFEGKSKLDHDLEALQQENETKLIQAKTHGLSGLAKILAGLQLGAYKGLKPINRMAENFGQVTTAAHQAGKAMDSAFGDQIQAKGRGMIGVVQDLANAWNAVGSNAGKTTPRAGGFTPRPNFTPRPVSPADHGVDYMSRLEYYESGNNPNAHASGSSAVGLGQFTKDTWMQFLSEMHPELLAQGNAALSLRTDSDLNRQATAWYASQNAVKLGHAGVDVNDANIYLAHFLGPGGAIAALTKSNETLLSSIPQLSAAINANPGVFNKLQTVGDLKNWSGNRFGTDLTAPITPGAFTQLAELFKYIKDPKDQAAARKVIEQERELAESLAKKNLSDFVKDAQASITAANSAFTTFDKNVAKLTKDIKDGKYGADRDVNSPQYKVAFDKAREHDAADKAREDRTKIHEKALQVIANTAEDIEKVKEQEEQLRQRLAKEEVKKPKTETAVGKIQKNIETVQKDASNLPASTVSEELDKLNKLKTAQQNVDFGNMLANEQKTVDKLKEGEMTVDEAREYAYEKQIKRLDDLLDHESLNADQRIQLERKVDEEKLLLQHQMVEESPIGKQFKNWADLGQNFQQLSAGWMNTFADDLAVMANKGKVNFQQMTNSIIMDMTKLAIKGAIGGIGNSIMGGLGLPMGGGGGMGGGRGKGMPLMIGGGGGKTGAPMAIAAGGGAGKGAAAGAATIGGTGGVLGGMYHWGGIVGGMARAYKRIDPRHFHHAARFHEGGFPGLDASEVPIIAKKGEEVGWPDQLAKKYGGTGKISHNYQNNVTVNAAGGSPEQNQDLAEKVARSVQDSMRAMVGSEISKQVRNGGILARSA